MKVSKGEVVELLGKRYVLETDAVAKRHRDYYNYTAVARQEDTRDCYFLKFVRCEWEENTGYRNLMREGQFRMHHPYIEHIYGGAEGILLLNNGDQDKIYGVLGEYIEGIELDKYRMDGYNDAMESRLFKHMMQFLHGVQYYIKYSQKDAYIHRDLKPENVMVDQNRDRIVICDFDWSHVSGSTATSELMNLRGGTKGYAAPLSMRNEVQRELYSVGRVLFFWMFGEHYYQDDEDIKNGRYLYDDKLGYGLYQKEDGIPEKYKAGKYKGFIEILRKLAAPPEKAYRDIDDVIRDMQQFLEAYYDGDKTIYREHIEDQILLNVGADRYIQEAQVIGIGFDNGVRKVITLEKYGFHEVYIDNRPVMAIYNLDDQLHYMIYTDDLQCIQVQEVGRISDGDEWAYQGHKIDIMI